MPEPKCPAPSPSSNQVLVLQTCPASSSPASSSPSPSAPAAKVVLVEDPAKITKQLRSAGENTMVFYYSVYSPASYISAPDKWYNLIDETKPLTFTEPSTKTSDGVLQSGIRLGHNKIVGPECNQIGLAASGNYTIVFQVKVGRLVRGISDIELLTMSCGSASSMDNKGMVLKLFNIRESKFMQTASMSLSMSNNAEQACTLDGNADLPLNDKIIYCFTIVKTPTKAYVYMSTSIDPDVTTLLAADNLRMSSDFLNIKMEMNRFHNLDGSIYALGGYNVALSVDDVRTVHEYLFEMQRKMTDKDYVTALQRVADAEKKYDDVSKCPLDASSCDACKDVKAWNSFDNIVTSDKDCLQSIDAFCSMPSNKKMSNCACWDDSNPKYGDVPCTHVRAAFSGRKLSSLARLDVNELADVKANYDLVDRSLLDSVRQDAIKAAMTSTSTSTFSSSPSSSSSLAFQPPAPNSHYAKRITDDRGFLIEEPKGTLSMSSKSINVKKVSKPTPKPPSPNLMKEMKKPASASPQSPMSPSPPKKCNKKKGHAKHRHHHHHPYPYPQPAPSIFDWLFGWIDRLFGPSS